jgi:hypothetical protein
MKTINAYGRLWRIGVYIYHTESNVFLSCFNHGLLVEIQITRRSEVDKITFYPFWYNSIYRDLGHFVR